MGGNGWISPVLTQLVMIIQSNISVLKLQFFFLFNQKEISNFNSFIQLYFFKALINENDEEKKLLSNKKIREILERRNGTKSFSLYFFYFIYYFFLSFSCVVSRSFSCVVQMRSMYRRKP